MDDLRILPAEDEAIETLHDGLRDYNDKFIPEKADLSLQLTDDEGMVLGGVDAFRLEDLVMVDALWVSGDQRGKGLGARILAAVEEKAKEQGAKRVELNTFGFQAPAFYEKLGYRRFGALEPAVKGYGHFFYVKEL